MKDDSKARKILADALRDIAEHAAHARKHGVRELAFASIRDDAKAALKLAGERIKVRR